MKFDGKLQRGIFLHRRCSNIVEAEAAGEKISVLCSNHNLLQNCSVLGSTIWFSAPVYLPCYMPAVWQLVEVDFGNLILVNNNLTPKLFFEGFLNKKIKISCLNPEDTIVIPNARLFADHDYDFNLVDKQSNKNCYVNVTCSLFNHDLERNNCNLFPEVGYDDDLSDEIYSLIHAKLLGHRAVLSCLICSEATDKLCITDKYNFKCAKLLKQALSYGVEFIAYRVNINFDQKLGNLDLNISDRVNEVYDFEYSSFRL